MKRILIVALLALFARGASTARADEPKEIPMTGNPAADAAFAVVNAMNRQLRMIDEDANAYLKAVEYYKQLQEMEQKVLAERKQLAQLDKQLSQQERDLKANFERERAGKSDADRDKLEAIYEQRRKELAGARKQVNGVPALLKTLGGHIRNQAKVLKGVKSKEDWVDPATGLGRARRQFQMQRNRIIDLTNKLAGITANVKAIIEQGSALDFKGEKVGAFEGRVVSVATPTPAWEWTVNGQTLAKGKTFAIGDDRVVRIQVKLVEDQLPLRRRHFLSRSSTGGLQPGVFNLGSGATPYLTPLSSAPSAPGAHFQSFPKEKSGSGTFSYLTPIYRSRASSQMAQPTAGTAITTKAAG